MKKKLEVYKKLIKVYILVDPLYVMFIVLEIGCLSALLYLFGILANNNSFTIFTLIIVLFTFIITNAFPTVYESYKLDFAGVKNKENIKVNKRKLIAFGNVLNTIVISAVIFVLFAYTNVHSFVILNVFIIFTVFVIAAGIAGYALNKQIKKHEEKPPK